MCWLQGAFPREVLADFLVRKAKRLPARERAYWQLFAGLDVPQERGGGRPAWAGTCWGEIKRDFQAWVLALPRA